MACDADGTQPFTLWFETLPSDDTASLIIQPMSGRVHVVLLWNQERHSNRSFETVEAARAWGYELRDVLLRDALAGALLGYDRDVLSRLQDQCSAP